MNIFKKKEKIDNTSMEQGVRMVTVAEPKSINTEQFNTIRTNIEFSGVDKTFKSLMLTSSVMSEGKSTIAANLAVAFSRQGKRVILVDADLRRPTFSSSFSIPNPVGLTNYLSAKDVKFSDIIYRTTVDNLCVVPSGPIPPNPSELIGSMKMQTLIEMFTKNSDLVIYDAPPVLSVTDAQIMSTKVDGTVLVIRAEKAEKKAIKEATSLIEHVGGHIIGAILNDVKNSSSGYYGYYSKES